MICMRNALGRIDGVRPDKACADRVGALAYRVSAAEELLRGQVLSEPTIEAAAARVTDGVEPLSDIFASAADIQALVGGHTGQA